MSPNPAAKMAQSKDYWYDALCILHGFQWPFRVEVSSEIPGSLGRNIQGRTIRLSPEGLSLLKEKHNISSYRLNVPNTLVVPEQCIILPVEALPHPPGFVEQQLKFGDHYNSISLKNVDSVDILAWAQEPSSYSTYSATELIPCTLDFAGVSTTEPFKRYAFVCPQKMVLSALKSGKTRDGAYIHRVPLSRIYKWNDINEACRQVSQQLDYVRLDSIELKVDYEVHYGFSYKVSESQETNPKENLNDVAKVEKEHAEMSAWVALDKKHKGYNLKGGEHLTREKVAEGDTNFENKTGGGNSTENSTATVNLNENSGEESAFFRKNENDNSQENDKLGNAKKTLPSKPKRIVVFANCFLNGTHCDKVQVDGIERGDAIIASLQERDDVIGKVVFTCVLPSIYPDRVFIGVHFEENINTEPFEIRHVLGGDEKNCIEKCEGTVKVFIPVEYITADTFAQGFLKVLKSSCSNSNVKRKSVSDIYVDYNYEAGRMDCVETLVKYGDWEILKGMGIEGNANSCYIDSVLFALYAFTANFDGGLLCEAVWTDNPSEDKKLQIMAARNLLKFDIITPLRHALRVEWTSVYKFRMALSEILNDKSYLGDFMDSEAFISSLFSQILGVSEFFVLGEDTMDYILQLFPPMDVGENGDDAGRPNHPCVQHLLQEYFSCTGVKLQDIPKSGFIIKLPVSDGVPHFKYVYPNLELKLGKRLLEKKDKSDKCVALKLRAVICLKKSHFTCFVRVKNADLPEATWYFHDSMAGESILTECPSLEIAIEMVATDFKVKGARNDYPEGRIVPREAENWLKTLLTTAYICIYEPPCSETIV